MNKKISLLVFLTFSTSGFARTIQFKTLEFYDQKSSVYHSIQFPHLLNSIKLKIENELKHSFNCKEISILSLTNPFSKNTFGREDDHYGLAGTANCEKVIKNLKVSIIPAFYPKEDSTIQLTYFDENEKEIKKNLILNNEL